MIKWAESPWRAEAACKTMGPELFFPAGELTEEAAGQVASAKAVCAQCPVREACAEFALATNQEDGIWGGLTPRERRAPRRRRGSAHPDPTWAGRGDRPPEMAISSAREHVTTGQADTRSVAFAGEEPVSNSDCATRPFHGLVVAMNMGLPGEAPIQPAASSRWSADSSMAPVGLLDNNPSHRPRT